MPTPLSKTEERMVALSQRVDQLEAYQDSLNVELLTLWIVVSLLTLLILGHFKGHIKWNVKSSVA